MSSPPGNYSSYAAAGDAQLIWIDINDELIHFSWIILFIFSFLLCDVPYDAFDAVNLGRWDTSRGLWTEPELD